MNSPIVKEEKVFDTKKEEILSFSAPAAKGDDVSEEESEAGEEPQPVAGKKEQPKKNDDKVVDMKTYSPFAK